MPLPVVNTYRVQMHAGFTFDDLRAVLPYLADLGVTHVYLSPITTAAPGSTHGYDVTDPTRLNPELGGDASYDTLVEAQRALGIGQVLDIVPNHMCIAPGAGNVYWEDVLRHGRRSRYGPMFDVEWNAHPEIAGRVVLPVLGDHLAAVLERGELTVDLGDGADDAWLRYYDARFPLAPASIEAWRTSDGSPEALRALLDRQHYVLDFWRDGHQRLNYRRFFAVDTLIGVHAEHEATFEVTHRLALDLVRRGAVDGLRIDHPDGLLDPQGYLERLHTGLAEAGSPEAYVLVEKILAPDESLPDAWRTDGTTGYDFMNTATRVLVDPTAEAALTTLYDEIAGTPQSYETIEDECRRHVVQETFRPHLALLAARLFEAERAVLEPLGRDGFVEALLHLLACLDRYRTYHRRDALDPRAVDVIARARERAERLARPGLNPLALDQAARLLAAPPEGAPREVVMQLQQVMPAVQAKGLEDRAFYRYRRLLALNEVGGDPGLFAESVEHFHRRIADEAQRRPHRMLATATHDHKRGEDVRARLAAVSELTEEWATAVRGALDAIEALQESVRGRVAPTDVYLLLQTVAGTLPCGMTDTRPEGDYPQRIADYMTKALREAGERTDWIDGDEAYEEAVTSLVHASLEADSPVLAAMLPVVERLAHLGAVNSLAQVVLKAAAPGVTDAYQGNEGWDLSLVDPDNRRPVDFEARAASLASLAPALDDGAPEERATSAARLLEGWRDGAIKTSVLARALRTRRAQPSLFLDGSYEPLAASGEHEANVIALARTVRDAAAVAVVPRLPGALLDTRGQEFWRPAWGDTTLALPPGRWRDAFTGAVAEGERAPLATLLGPFPVALLLREA